MLRVAILKFAGIKTTVPTDVQEWRHTLCRFCSSNDFGQCQECTCLVLPKTWLTQESCPLGHWDVHLTEPALRSLFKQSWLPCRLQKLAIQMCKALD